MRTAPGPGAVSQEFVLDPSQPVRLDRVWVRLGGAVGIAAVVLFVASAMASGTTLSSNSSTAQITDYLASHRNVVLTQTVLTIAGSALALWFGATLARVLHDRDGRSPLGTIVLVGAVGMGALASLDGVTLTALEMVAKQGGLTEPSLVHAFYDLQDGVIMPGAFGFMAAVFLVAVGLAALRRVFAAPWVGYLSLVLAALALVSSVVGLTVTDGGTSAFGFFPALGFGVITLIAGIFMLREPAETLVL